MKITAIHTKGVGPINDGTISLVNDWTEEVEEKVLFTGPNGCGKSTLLQAVSMLWKAAGFWLDKRKVLPRTHEINTWLKDCRGVAVVFDGIEPFFERPVGLFYGSPKWVECLKEKQPEVLWIGEVVTVTTARLSKVKKTTKKLEKPDEPGFEKWSECRKKMVISHDVVEGPNIIYLDAEDRRWVTPTRNLAEPTADDSSQRWLTTYEVTEDWQGQLEASLITLKLTQPRSFHAVVKTLNKFLFGKAIDTNIKPGEDRLRVKLTGQRSSHLMDKLSAGEHQVLILVYLISRWMQPGGIVLIDEPDMYLHPSLVKPLLARLERLVAGNDGQLMITSHAIDVWRRYENHGLRYKLNDADEVNV